MLDRKLTGSPWHRRLAPVTRRLTLGSPLPDEIGKGTDLSLSPSLSQYALRTTLSSCSVTERPRRHHNFRSPSSQRPSPGAASVHAGWPERGTPSSRSEPPAPAGRSDRLRNAPARNRHPGSRAARQADRRRETPSAPAAEPPAGSPASAVHAASD